MLLAGPARQCLHCQLGPTVPRQFWAALTGRRICRERSSKGAIARPASPEHNLDRIALTFRHLFSGRGRRYPSILPGVCISRCVSIRIRWAAAGPPHNSPREKAASGCLPNVAGHTRQTPDSYPKAILYSTSRFPDRGLEEHL